MAGTGLSQSFTFGTTTVAASGCIQSSSLDNSVNAAMYQCGGVMKTALGAKTYVFQATLAYDETDTTVGLAFEPGDNSTIFKYFPGGVTSGNIKFTSTKAWVVAARYTAPVNGVITLDITINLDALTIGASTGA